jgi:UDP-N-acetylmuramoyl-L-alanyl-D-glutamate--2,6-diaminopimelate ligase
MRLGDLLRGLAPELPPAVAALEVTGLGHDSRRVGPGDLYLAIPGARFDGREFLAEAASRGAVAALGPGPAPPGAALPFVENADPRRILAILARRLYGPVGQDLKLVGITGTNGKSTTVTLTAAMFAAAGVPAASLGTLGYLFADRSYLPEVRRTTPEAPDLYRVLAEMVKDGARAAAMEVSSHSLTIGRVDGLLYDVAAFTNLTRDHLDFHPDMESYFAAKRGLFDRLKPNGRAVVHLGDSWGKRLAAELPGALTFGIGEGEVRSENVELSFAGTRARVITPRGAFDLSSPLIGRYNLENLLTAIAVAEALELPQEAILAAIAALKPVNGRLEPVLVGEKHPPALVDYAHTPAALEALLRSVREIAPDRKIVLVFGCGGERDRGKRPLMGRIAGELAEMPVLTSDNPRREDPLQILVEVEKGVKESGNDAYRMVPDRHEAILGAVRAALRGQSQGERWVILLAGKGHESTQDLGDRVIPFSDRAELEAALRHEIAAMAAGARHG